MKQKGSSEAPPPTLCRDEAVENEWMESVSRLAECHCDQ